MLRAIARDFFQFTAIRRCWTNSSGSRRIRSLKVFMLMRQTKNRKCSDRLRTFWTWRCASKLRLIRWRHGRPSIGRPARVPAVAVRRLLGRRRLPDCSTADASRIWNSRALPPLRTPLHHTRTYKVGQTWQHFYVPQFRQILTDVQNSFTVRMKRKFALTLSLKIPPRLTCVATLPCEMSLKLTRNNVCIVSVIVLSNCHILLFLHQMFNVSALLLGDTLKPMARLIKRWHFTR